MSVQAMAWALKQQQVVDHSARHVLLCLANYADSGGGSAFPSVQTICRDTGLSERTVRYKLDELERVGAITRDDQAIVAFTVKRADQRPVNYRINVDSGVQKLHLDRERGANGAGNGVQSTTERGAAIAPEPSVNHQQENRKDYAAHAANGSAVWKSYSDAYEKRYGAKPVRNAKVNAILKNLLSRIPASEAPAIAAFYVEHPNSFYVQRGHAVDCLLRDAEKLRTEWATDQTITASQARASDRTAANAFAQMLRHPEALTNGK